MIRRTCDGCGAEMGACRFPAVIEIGPGAGRPGMLATRLELRPVDVADGREVDVCRDCIVRGLAARER